MSRNKSLRGKLTLVAIVVLMLVMTACGGNSKESANASEGAESSPSSSENGSSDGNAAPDSDNPNAQWALDVGLDKTETTDELYELAKKEGKVVVYSQSSRIKDVKASFEEKYPGITVEGYKMSSPEIVEKVIREQESKVWNSDVIFVKDSSGSVSNEMIKKGMVHKYLPTDIQSTMMEPFKSSSPGLVMYFSVRTIYYNNEVYDEPPITNWWDLTDPKWKGKVLVDDPIQSSDTMDLFLSFVQHADEMAEAYKEKFGKEIVLDGTDNAGYEFFKQLFANDVVLVKSSDEAVEAVGAKGQDNPPIAIAAASKLREVEEKGLKVGASWEVKPRLSVKGPAYLYVTNEAEHPNAAKLFIRWMAGEVDGTGKGFEPYNVSGSYSTRPNVVREDNVPLDQLKLWDYDSDYFYNNYVKFREFWIKSVS
ncbi:ABC transporter substrate-binding protein [Cohnella herbarum]|uniref:Extracellular solute-binding protein n=1 Tax=Cohnella herbarum TaxID=2728023 RepID=A0A7Z2VQK2_9BACL|nr:extracellular solute-binding protein [Cohnella herbarum]QJD87272.1 extracellular solute-binding protein [Cohnella herbarum]